MILLVLTMTSALASAGKSGSKGHDYGNHIDVSGHKSHLDRLEVVCSRDHMTVHMHFDEPFHGMVFSHSSPRHERCVHVGPRAGVQSASFDIRYDGCGTVEDLSGKFHENTIVIQFGEDILEAWDEAKRLRCEWLESFEKPSSKPTLAISDLDIVELNFQGDDIDCWMEIQEGKGPWARQVGGLVPIGSPLTMVIAINDHSKEFDMRIKRCSASDGKGSEIELTDHNGCVLRPSLLTPFAKVRDFGAKATLVAYSHLYAFKFPDKMDVFVHCIVEVCRHGCPDACSHQAKGYYQPRETFDTLESKKHQKLVELANSKPVHQIHVSAHHQTLKSASADSYPLPGREKNREILITAAQEQVQHISLKNSSLHTAVFEGRKVIRNEATFKPPAVLKDTQKTKETKSQIQSSSSNVQSVFADIGNNLHTDHDSKFNSHATHPTKNLQNIQLPPEATYHKIIGHDIHWISENVKKVEDPIKQNLPSLKDISYQAPQPEPAAWSADDVKPLTKQEVFQPHHAPRTEVALNFHQYEQKSHTAQKTHVPWSLDETKHHSPFQSHIYKEPEIPQPEPAAWSADDVKPLTKEEVFRHRQALKPELDANIHHYHQAVHKTHIPWSGDAKPQIISVHQNAHKKPEIPQPEPAPWKFEEVNPMHSPEVFRLHLHTKRPEEPKPEPTSWTLEEVKPLSKEDLRLISLNHKIKSNPHLDLPVYREIAHPFFASTIPQPVYVSRYTISPQNMSSPNMMKMMMMMPTLLPQTYQTAHWPQRATTRYLRPQRHHYPYPIPQFSPQQQMMMSVIADRRMDGENDDGLNESLHPNSDEGATNPSVIFIGDTARSRTHPGDEESSYHSGETRVDAEFDNKETASDSAREKQVLVGETFNSKTTPKSEVLTDSSSESLLESLDVSSPIPSQMSTDGKVSEFLTTPEDLSKATTGKLDDPTGERPPISSFVPPALDGFGINPETKDRTAHGPRALDRRKRSSAPVFGVRQKFQAIAPSDLAFEWNVTADSAAVFRGRREEIVYGICMSPAGMSAGVGFILVLTLLSIIVSVVLYEHSCLLTKKTSQLSFLTRNFNGRFEALYRITRPYLYTDGRNVR